MALTELTAPGFGAVVDGLHPVITVVHADEPTRHALAAASLPGVVLIGSAEAMQMATMAVAHRVDARRETRARRLAELRQAGEHLAAATASCAAAEEMLAEAAARLRTFEHHLGDVLAGQEDLRLAHEDLRRAEADALAARAELEDGKAKRAEAEATIAEALAEVERGDAEAGAVSSQIAEVRRALDLADERRRAAMEVVDRRVEEATERARQAEGVAGDQPGRLLVASGLAHDEGSDRIASVAAVGDALRARAVAAHDALDEALRARDHAEAAVREAERRVPREDGISDDGPRPIDVFTSLESTTEGTVVFVEPFPPFPSATVATILAAVVRLARTVQVVYVTELPYLIEWAQALPPGDGAARFATIEPFRASAPAPRASGTPALTAT